MLSDDIKNLRLWVENHRVLYSEISFSEETGSIFTFIQELKSFEEKARNYEENTILHKEPIRPIEPHGNVVSLQRYRITSENIKEG